MVFERISEYLSKVKEAAGIGLYNLVYGKPLVVPAGSGEDHLSEWNNECNQLAIEIHFRENGRPDSKLTRLSDEN